MVGIQCSRCRGLGLLRDDKTGTIQCPDCRGRGFIELEKDKAMGPAGNATPCKACNRSGEVWSWTVEEKQELRTCTRCNGTGQVQEDTYAGTCPRCLGVGREPEEEAPTMPGVDDFVDLHSAKADNLWFTMHVAGSMAFRTAYLMSNAPVRDIFWGSVARALILDLRVASREVILPEYLACLGARAIWLPTAVLAECLKAIPECAEEAGARLPADWARCFDPEEAVEVQEP